MLFRRNKDGVLVGRGAYLLLFALMVLAGMSSATAAGIFRVNAASASTTPDGLTWATAFKDIQAGIYAAEHSSTGGGEVWVAAGTYTNVSPNSMAVALTQKVDVYGGFAGAETGRSQRNWAAHVTVIDGENTSQGVTGDDDSTIDGFTITRGYSSGSGGGMYNSSTTPLVANCIFLNNRAFSGAGAMENNSASPTVINCTFSGNQAVNDRGGAVENYLSSATFTNCVFSGNTAQTNGGAVLDSGGAPTFTNCLFSENSAIQGAALYNSFSTALLMNCTFSGNSVGAGASAIYNNNPGLTLTNCIAWGDAVAEITGTAAVVTYSCVQGGYTGTGNIATDPMFVSDSTPFNLKLQAGSPCIDTGTAAGAPATDLLGLSRPFGAGDDMGAYEHGAQVPTVAVPNVVGLASASAETAITDAGLTFTVVEETSVTVPAGQVISQNPAAGTSVATGTDVTLTVSTGPTGASGCAGCQTAQAKLTAEDLKTRFGDTFLSGLSLLTLLALRKRVM